MYDHQFHNGKPQRRVLSASDGENRGAPLGPVSKTEYVLVRLRREISEGVLSPGFSLRQSDLAERFGVSATPVREALRLLEAEGTITYVTHHGATVAELSDDRVVQLYLMRARLEGLACSRAAGRMTPGELARAEELHAQLEATGGRGDHAELSRLNREFHFAIYEATSPLIASHVKMVWKMMPVEVSVWGTERAALRFIQEHEGILEALRDGDGGLADQRMQQHIATAGDIRRGIVESHGGPA